MEPTKKQIRAQLEKIVSSEAFLTSPRKRKFLRYIVEKTLDGEGASLKGMLLVLMSLIAETNSIHSRIPSYVFRPVIYAKRLKFII